MSSPQSFYQTLDFGIHCIDTGLSRPGHAACYLMEQDGEAAVIETGTAHTAPRILTCLKEQGFAPEQVRFVFITHVHLDHAGGAGALLAHLPQAKLVVHPRGARHMIDPAKLQASATAVYGEEQYQKTYGNLMAIDESRLHIAEDESEFFLGGRRLRVLDTPGHARHHFCVFDEISRGIFSGDTMGVVYRELMPNGPYFIMPTTTPIQFDPTALKSSIDRLMDLKPNGFYLTHYGLVEDTERHAHLLKQEVDNYVAIANRCADHPNRLQAITDGLMEHSLNGLRQAGSPLSLDQQRKIIQGDIRLNAQGLEHWLSHDAK